MQAITVKSVAGKETSTGSTLITIIDDAGSRFSTFDRKALDLRAGDIIEADFEVKKGFVNLTRWTKQGHSQPSAGAASVIQAITQPEVSLRKAEIVSRLWAAGKLSDSDPLVTGLRSWLGDRSARGNAPIGEGQ